MDDRRGKENEGADDHEDAKCFPLGVGITISRGACRLNCIAGHFWSPSSPMNPQVVSEPTGGGTSWNAAWRPSISLML
jgi:hypothetical protein